MFQRNASSEEVSWPLEVDLKLEEGKSERNFTTWTPLASSFKVLATSFTEENDVGTLGTIIQQDKVTSLLNQ